METHRLTTPPQKLIAAAIGRFYRSVVCDLPSHCWLWQAKVTKDGYGCIQLNGKKMAAHRFSYFYIGGAAPNDAVLVCHACDNPVCVNPAHLWAGTHADNMGDMVRKGRSVRATLVGVRDWNDERVTDVVRCKLCRNLYRPSLPNLKNGDYRCKECIRIAARERYRAKTNFYARHDLAKGC